MILWLLVSIFIDYASFPYRGRIYKTEFYYQISYQDLVYWTRNDSLISECLLIYRIRSGKKELVDTIKKTVFLESYGTAKKRDISIVDQYDLFLLPGDYDYQITYRCSLKAETLTGNLTLRPIGEELLLSDVELAVSTYPDTTKTPFSKSGLTVIPNPSRRFGGQWNAVYPYIEVHNLIPDSNYYTVAYLIRDDQKKLVKKVTQKSQKIYTAQREILGIDVTNLKPGDYTMEIVVKDSSAGKEAHRSKGFEVVKTKQQEDITDKYDKLIRAIKGEAEYNRYQKLPLMRKRAYIKEFLKSHRYQDFKKRIDYANENFRCGSKPGWRTDRGRIYIKYGPPDEVTSKIFEEKIRPVEHWFYYSQGLHFIFMDLVGTDDYLLMWSDSQEEENYPNWERYLPEWAIEEY